MDRLTRKHETARALVPPPLADIAPGAAVGIIAYGSTDPAIVEARDLLAAQGVATSYLRLRALPLEQTTRDFVARHDLVCVVEQNQDGQMRQLVQLHCPERAAHIRGVAHSDGLPLTARFVAEAVRGVL
jgi:2-oxoglutarate ferredoxin oxidoreductase subunit alpha